MVQPWGHPDVPGEVAFRVEAVPFHSGANGEHYCAGKGPADQVAKELRDLADQVERYWTADKVERP